MDGCKVLYSVFHCRQDENIFIMIFDIFGPQNVHFGIKNGFVRVILLNVALKVYLNRFKVEGCRVWNFSAFHFIYKIGSQCLHKVKWPQKCLFGSKNWLFGPKNVNQFINICFLTLQKTVPGTFQPSTLATKLVPYCYIK